MPELISSSANPLIRRMRQLADRRHRRREGAFVVQGIQPVWHAVRSGAPVETLVVAPALLTAPAVVRLVEEQEERGVRVARVTAELFGRLADRDGPTGLAAIVRARQAGLADLTVRPFSVFVALHEIGNPGNLGTIIRTADAAGMSGVALIGQATDPHDPAAVKASMGALFNIPVAQAASADEFFGWTAAAGVTVAAASGGGAAEIWAAELPRPLAILLGSEGPGLPDSMLARSAATVRIPMTGTAESLNLAVAAGILMYETWRRDGGPALDAGPAIPENQHLCDTGGEERRDTDDGA
ncbi:MAG TPA: RNA methyltransferase [Streptosporangiaceae bacterium]|jgi:TrmH family RNA methyltransferase